MGELIGRPAEMQVSFKGDLFQKFIDYTDVKETTLQGYKVCLHQFALWTTENGIEQPTRDDIKAYKVYLERQGYTAGTRAQYLRAVKHFFKWTASEGIYPNIADGIKGAKVKQDNTKKEAFTEADVLQILNSIDTTTEAGKRDYCLILLSITGGLRLVEMQRANIADLQIIKGQKVLYIQGKGRDEKDEYIKIVPEVEMILEDYLKTRGHINKNSPLFAGIGNRANGERMTVPSLSRIVKQRFRAAGYDCEKLTAHSMRHTSNTLLFKAGYDLYQVQHHARHANPATTEIYLHALDREKDKSEQAIYNQIFRPEENYTQEATELFKQLDAEDQAQALEYIKSLYVKARKGA